MRGLADLCGKRVVVWGYGREGRAAVTIAQRLGAAEVTVVDDATAVPGSGDVAVLSVDEARPILDQADYVIKSPGISKYDPRLVELRRRGTVVTGATNLWMQDHYASVTAVTGSKGKSTTSALIHHLMAAAGIPNTLGGNIGVPVLALPDADRYVLELSSYQCADLDVSPDIAVLTALFPDHLDWHRSVEQYYLDKLNLIAWNPRVVVYNSADARLATMVKQYLRHARPMAVGTVGSFHVAESLGSSAFMRGTEVLFPASVSPLRGPHNAINVCLALAAAEALGMDCVAHRDPLREALRCFEPLAHRLTQIVDASGIVFVDDSLATAPEATVAAMQSFPDDPLAVIVGGFDRGLDYSVLRRYLRNGKRAVTVIGLPQNGSRILDALEDLPNVRRKTAANLEEAVRIARHALPVGGTAILSPGAPSYGEFRNYEDRSARFEAAIKATV